MRDEGRCECGFACHGRDQIPFQSAGEGNRGGRRTKPARPQCRGPGSNGGDRIPSFLWIRPPQWCKHPSDRRSRVLMQFNSFPFLFLFLPAVSILYYVSARRLGTRAAQGTLVLSSLVFYSLGNPVYIPVLLGSILFNYWLGQTIVGSLGTVRKRLLVLGLAVNIA